MKTPPDPPRRALFRVISRTAGMGAIAVGGLVVCGWVFAIPWLKSISPDWVSMKLNTAVCFILAGVALVIRQDEQAPRPRLLLAQAGATIIALVALLTLGEYALKVDFGIDQLLRKEAPTALETSNPGRMSPATAFNFLLIGLAVLGLDWKTRKGVRPTQALPLLTALISLLAFTGYLYGVKSLYAFSPFSSMAVHTALLFFVVSVGVLSARSGEGPFSILTSQNMGGAMARRLLPFAVGVPLLLGWLRLQGQLLGYYGFEFGLALYATLNIFVFTSLIWITALWLNRADARRQRLEAKAAQWAAIVESSEDAIIGKNLYGVITSWNPGAMKIFGYSAGEMTGHSVTELIPPERQDEEVKIMGRIKRGESVEHFDTVRMGKDGRRIEISVTVSPIKDAEGRIIGASKVARNITERKRAEQQLKVSLKEVTDLKAALDEHAIVAMTDAQGKITYANDKFCAISKYTREELLGQDHRIINSGHHPKEFIRDLWTTIAHGRVWHGEIKNKAKDGSFYWVDTTIVPFLNEQGKPRQYVAIRADITELKRVEESLRKSEAQLQTIVESLAEGVVVSDLQGQVLHFNRAALDLHGFASLDEIRLHLSKFADIFELSSMDGTVLPLDQWPLSRILRGEQLHDLEVRIRRRTQTGWQRVLSYGGTLAHDASGQPLMAIVTISDITLRKQSEEKIHELNTSLELRIAERTAQLEMANKELEAFSYSVSHDLRAPLRAVDGFSQAVEEDYGPQLPEEGRRYLRTIRDGAQRMGALIDDLLAFSRLSRQPLSKQPVNTGALVRGILEELTPQRQGRPIEIRIGDLPPCEGDPALLKQVWINLLSNALKYTRKRAAAVVEIGCTREKGEDIYFVRDNGAGFDMQYAHKLFSVFQRLHRVEDYEGTGVGLAIVQRIVHRHGGRVWADAALDRGATFHFTLNGKTKI